MSVFDPKSLPGVRTAIRYIPLNVLKHWLYPFLVRGRREDYDAKTFFESWHNAAAQISDGSTISLTQDPASSRYHYNAVENTLLRWFILHPRSERPSVLDIGAGAGHWIGFYRQVLQAQHVTGIDLSETACAELRRKFPDETVDIRTADISTAGFQAGSYDIINAIGVMFHIVDDRAWERAIGNLASALAPGGVFLVGGQFGFLTRNVQFHKSDRFESWQDFREAKGERVLVNKRIRSLRAWRRAAAQAGLRVVAVLRTPQTRGIPTPENHVLVLQRRSS